MATRMPYQSYKPQYSDASSSRITNADPPRMSNQTPHRDRNRIVQGHFQTNPMSQAIPCPNTSQYQPTTFPGSNGPTMESIRQQGIMTNMHKALFAIVIYYEQYKDMLPNFMPQEALPVPSICVSCRRDTNPPAPFQQTDLHSSSGSRSITNTSNAQTETAFWRQKYEDLQRKLPNIRDGVQALQQDLQKAYEDREDLRNRCAQAEKEARELREKHTEFQREQNRLKELIASVKTRECRLSAVLANQTDLQTKMSLESLCTNLEHAKAEIREQRANIADVQNMCREQQNRRTVELGQSRKEICDLRKSCSRTVCELDKLKDNVQEFADIANVEISKTDLAETSKCAYADASTQANLRRTSKGCHKEVQTLRVPKCSTGSQTVSTMTGTQSASTQTQSNRAFTTIEKSEIIVIAHTSPIERSEQSRERVSTSVESNSSRQISLLSLDNCRDESEKVMKSQACAVNAISELQQLQNKYNLQNESATQLLLDCFDMVMPKGAFDVDAVAQKISENGHMSKERASNRLNDISGLPRKVRRQIVEIPDDDPEDFVETCRPSVWDVPDTELFQAPLLSYVSRAATYGGLKRKGAATTHHAYIRSNKRTKQ